MSKNPLLSRACGVRFAFHGSTKPRKRSNRSRGSASQTRPKLLCPECGIPCCGQWHPGTRKRPADVLTKVRQPDLAVTRSDPLAEAADSPWCMERPGKSIARRPRRQRNQPTPRLLSPQPPRQGRHRQTYAPDSPTKRTPASSPPASPHHSLHRHFLSNPSATLGPKPALGAASSWRSRFRFRPRAR